MSLTLPKCLLLVILLVFTIKANEDHCPSKCSCNIRDGVEFISMKCGKSGEKIANLDEIDLLNVASEIIHLNLSDNLLTTFYPKVQLIALQKLDLSRNQLTELQNYQFSELPSLRRLDLTNNNIKSIELQAFANLSNLERLKLSQNQITSITVGTFDPLPSLKQLDLSSNPLTCDCSLLWLLAWSQSQSVKLVSNPRCSSPPSFRGQPLRKLRVGVDIHCKSPSTTIDLEPNVNQVVFEGDSLGLHCRAPSLSDSPASARIEWTWLDSDPKSYFDDVAIESHFLQSTGLIDSTLRIGKLRRNHTGIWTCLLISRQGNHSKGITVVVISDETQYCPITVTTNDKGTYTWPRTVVNYTATIPCASINENYDVSTQKISYYCSENGQWENLNSSSCTYISETTRIFQQFSKVNSSIMESAKHFRNFTSNLNNFKELMDIVYTINTIDNYLKYLSVEPIGIILMEVTNNLLKLPKQYLWSSNDCAKLVNATEKLAAVTSSSYLHKSNIALEIFPVKKKAFSGLKCTWYVDVDSPADRQFYCATNSQAELSEFNGKMTEASVTVPETLFQDLLERNYDLRSVVYNILIAMHSGNKLFPVGAKGKDVRSAVVGAKLVDFPVANLTEPIFIMLKYPRLYDEATTFTPVWWDSEANNGSGNWSTDGCYFSHEYRDHIIFYCHHFGYYGLLQDISLSENANLGAEFRFSHPAIYVGSLILFISLFVAITTYLFCYQAIQMPKKAKHSLINLWIAISLLCFLYVFGIHQTEDVKVCQIIGMLLHYFTLSSLLWTCVGVNCMYKRLSKNNIMQLQEDDLPAEPIKKPIIGLYFVGWGVAMIICGISAAINIREYSTQTYCFLRPGPPLSALYIPTVILLMFLCIFFLLIKCAISNLDTNGHLSEGTQATENVDLDLLEPNFPETRSIAASSKTSQVEDSEHAPSAQLKAYIIFLFLYLMAWLSCAFATVVPYHFLSFEEDLFSIVYAIIATILSAFTLFFYCVARNDIRTQWVIMSRWLRRKPCFRSRNVSDTAQNLAQIQIQPLPLVPNANSLILSRSSSQSSHTKSSNALKGADLNGTYTDIHGKINNVNLIVLHRQQYRTAIPNIIENPTSAAEVFYNPHQSTVARKFFKRQKRHLMQKNNLTTRQQRDSDAASVLSDIKQMKDNSSEFATNSKVNNTNIHVEQIRRKHLKNPNLFSDSQDSLNNVPTVEHIVLNAERLRKKEITKHRSKKKHNTSSAVIENNMRTVSQQCTLEYSSENVSDSILGGMMSADHVEESSDLVPSERRPNSPNLLTDETYCKLNSEKDNEILYNPSELMVNRSIDDGLSNLPMVYVNPSHDLVKLGVQTSRGSSMSVSDLDELYQQIRRGPKINHFYKFARDSPCLSDSDINSYVCEGNKSRVFDKMHLSDDVETTV